MKKLNAQYRGKNKTTDVLSFAMDEEENLLGDILLSLDQAKRQATEHKHSLRHELLILIIHGLLHLLGYDHETDEDYKVMFKKEKEVLKKVECSC